MFQNVKIKEFKELALKPNTLIVDVRTGAEFDSGAIEGAINIDVMAPDFKAEIQKLNKDNTYLVYCRSGARSVSACFNFLSEGFTKLYNLEGGIMSV